MNYEIVADVSLDIDKEFAKENDIRYVAMEYTLGGEEFHCTEPESDEMMHNYYEKLRGKVPTHTSQIVPNHYLEAFEPYVREKRPLIYISLSSGLSNTYESALMAVNMLKDEHDDVQIEVIDSLGGTGGMGLLAECAANNRAAGMSLEDNAAWLRKHARYINYWFKVEDLMYLMRGGRVSAATAVVGTALNIKPILTINAQGRLDTVDKKRGTKQACKNMAERFEATFCPEISKVVYICCADCMKDAALLKEMLVANHSDIIVRTTMLSPIIGAHTGPDMLSLIYFGEERTDH